MNIMAVNVLTPKILKNTPLCKCLTVVLRLNFSYDFLHDCARIKTLFLSASKLLPHASQMYLVKEKGHS